MFCKRLNGKSQIDMHNNVTVSPKARHKIHEVVLEWFSKHKSGKVLDAPAGYGHLSMNLDKMGFQVVAGEIEPEQFRAEGLECIYVDLNRRIDAPDASFDYVCCLDGLEHMTNPYKAVEEFARVLKPGGTGVFSIPNYSNIEKRFKFLLNGYLTKPVDLSGGQKSEKRLFNVHNSPLTITLLWVMFDINDLSVSTILKDKTKIKQYLFFPFVFPLKCIAFFSSERSRKKHRTDLTLRNDVIFGGNTLIFIVRKAICEGRSKSAL